jgi:hypothetical protein
MLTGASPAPDVTALNVNHRDMIAGLRRLDAAVESSDKPLPPRSKRPKVSNRSQQTSQEGVIGGHHHHQ